MAIADQFAGLPLGQLIAQPLVEVAKGQAELCEVYLSYLFRMAYKDGKKGEQTNILEFTLNRQIISEEGASSVVPIKVQAPLLSLVPVPAFVMDEATVRFNMEVTEQTLSKNTGTEEVTASYGSSFWGCHANITGKVAATQENTRKTDHSAKYEIYARAVQQEPAEGMAKLTSIFASVIEPVMMKS